MTHSKRALLQCVGVAVLAPVMAITSLTVPAYAEEPWSTKSTGSRAQAVESFDACKATLDHRTETTDVYKNANGTFTAVIAPEKVNFKDGLGNWQKIDNNLRVEGDRIVNGAGVASVSFAKDGSSDELVTVVKEGKDVSFGLNNAKASEAKIEKNTVTYSNIMKDVDLRYIVTADGVTEHLIVKSDKGIQDRFDFALSTKGVGVAEKADKSLEFKNDKGVTVLSVPHGKAWEEGNKSTASEVRVSLAEAKDVVSVVPDVAWLKNDKRTFPLVIDPDITFGGGPSPTVADTYINSATVNTNYNGQSSLNIGRCNAGESYSYIRWDMSSITGQTISDASLRFNATFTPPSSVTSVQPIRMWHVNETWNANDFTWAKTTGTPPQGNHDSTGADLWGVTSAGQYSFDLTDWTRNWSSGSWPNYGLSMDGGGHPTACWALQSGETGSTGPALVVTYGDHDTGRRDFMSYFDQQVDSQTGLSVNLANGNLNVSMVDIQAPGVGMDMRLERNWSSLKAANQKEFGDTAWQYGATQARIYPTNSNATVYLPGGSPAVFSKLGGQYVAPPGINAKLTTTGTGTSATWTLKFNRSEDTWTFRGLTNGQAYLWKQADRNNNTITYNYNTSLTTGTDNWPRLTSITDTFGQNINLTYSGNRVTKATDWAGRYVDYIYTGSRLIRAEDMDRGWHPYGYTGNMLRWVYTDEARGLQLTYDSKGRVTEILRYDSTVYSVDPKWTFAYTDLSNGQGTTTLTDPNGNATVYTWDGSGRVTKTKDPLGHEQKGAWTPNSDKQSTTDALSATTNGSYDSNNNLTSVQSPTDGGVAGRTNSFAYADATNPHRMTSKTDTQGRSTALQYDTAGNMTQATSAQAANNVTQLSYNTDGTVASARDGKGTYTYYGYTGKRLTSITHPAPLGSESFTYDTVGRLKTHTDGKGQTRTYNYDNLSNITSVAVPGSTTVSYAYDGDGLLIQRVDGVGTWNFTYDRLLRQKTKSVPGGSSNSVTHDGAGNVVSYTDSNGTINYTYDAANNVTKLAEPGGSCSGTVSLCTTFNYDDNNRRTSTAYPNGVTQNVTYDSSGRIKTVKATRGSTVLTDYSYQYRSAAGADSGLTSKITDHRLGHITDLYYDEMNRLEDAITHSVGGAYIDEFYFDWDANSNRTAYWRKGMSSTDYFNHNTADQITSAPGVSSFTYDANGSTTANSGGFTSSYNSLGQATSVKGTGTASATSMTYADVGQSERTSAGSTSYRWRLIGGLADETTAGVTTSYVMDAAGNLVSQKRGTTRSYYLMDKLGSIVGLTDSSGNVAQRFEYDPFGKLLTTSITTDSKFKFASGYYDSANKLYKFGERYYDPALARWTQRDTLAGAIDDPTTMNRYVYVGGDPINYVDPTGRIRWKDVGKKFTAGVLGGAIAGGVTGCLAATVACPAGALAGAQIGIIGGGLGGATEEIVEQLLE